MSDKRQSASVAWWMAGMALMLVSLAILSGCTRTVYEPVETVRTEYRDNIKEIHVVDSVTDTRFVYVKGDTVVDWRDRIKWRDRIVHDSIYIRQTDSIPVPYPVERPLSRWEQAKMDLGGIAMGGVAVAVCFAVIWLIKRFRHNR